MSDTFDAAAHAAATETAAAPPPEETRAPQAEVTAPPADQNTEAPATSEEPTPDEPTDAPETPSRGDKRVQQLLAERHALREQLAYFQGAAQRGQQPDAPQAPQQAGPQPLSTDLAQWVGAEPKPEDFPNDGYEFGESYRQAVRAYDRKLAQAEFAQMQRVQVMRQAEASKAQAFIQEAAKVEKERPDFREVAGRLGASLPNEVANMLAKAGADVVYAVGKDPDAEARIRAARDRDEVAFELGQIRERIRRPRETPSPQPTSAPEPAPRAVRGGNAGTRSPADMPMGEYAAWRAKQTWD
jgi:hypothetical protein